MSVKDVQKWLNGEYFRSERIRKQYKLFFLIAALVFLYILSGYWSIRQQHRLTDVKKEMMDAKFEYMTVSAQFVNSTRPSQIAVALEQRGSNLQENAVPPVKLK